MTLHIDNIRPYDATQKNTQAAGTTAAAYNTTDFVRFGDNYYEIVKISEPKLLYGQAGEEFEILADCLRARDGLFNAS